MPPQVFATVFTRCKHCGQDLEKPFERVYIPGEQTWSPGPNCMHSHSEQAALAFPIHILVYGECNAADKTCARSRAERLTLSASCALCGTEVNTLTLAEIQARGGVVTCEPDCETARKQRQAAAEWGALVDTVETVKAMLTAARGIKNLTVPPETYAEMQLVLGGKTQEAARQMVELAELELKQNAS